MKDLRCPIFCACVSSALLFSSGFASAQVSLAQPQTVPTWQIVVNNGFAVPGDGRLFNSYNQPSINAKGLVVFRGRSKGGESGTGEPAHGVYLRDMSLLGNSVTTLFDRNTLVPQPNSLGAMFTEPPSFPRIDMYTNTVASRGSHQPVLEYWPTGATSATKAGTTGIYTNPFYDYKLLSGANNLGAAPGFGFFAVPGVADTSGNPIKFDVFPGAPAVADKNTIVFKGNYTVAAPTETDPNATASKTGVYYRRLADAPAGGDGKVIKIADNGTLIPGTNIKFGSTAPPSAVGNQVVFAGFDNEDEPTAGGIYLATLNSDVTQAPKLTTLIGINKTQVPGEAKSVFFNKLGEGLSFDGRFVAFWGAWGTETTPLVLQCPTDGNKNVIAECQKRYGDGVNTGTEGTLGFKTSVPVHQGIFVYDIIAKSTWAVAKAPTDFADFVYWNFSGKVTPPQGGTGVDGTGDGETVTLAEEGSGGGGGTEGDTDGEPARWRSASFVAVSGLVDGKLTDATAHAVFKARKGHVTDGRYADVIDGIYLRKGPPDASVKLPFTPLVVTGMDGTLFDPAARYQLEIDEVPYGDYLPLPVTAMGIERDGFRGNTVVLNISMGNEDAGWAGIYLTKIAK